jgi:predicted cobalt transporter CbtA
MRALALIPLAIPHLIGAPEPEHHGGLAPESLATQFIYAALITNFVFWLALGGLVGFAHSWFERRAATAD